MKIVDCICEPLRTKGTSRKEKEKEKKKQILWNRKIEREKGQKNIVFWMSTACNRATQYMDG